MNIHKFILILWRQVRKECHRKFLPSKMQRIIIIWLLTNLAINVRTETIDIDTEVDLVGHPSFTTDCRYFEDYENVTCSEDQDIPSNPDPSIGFWASNCTLTSCSIKYTHKLQDQVIRNNEFTVKAYITQGQFLQVYKKTNKTGDHEYTRISGDGNWVERTVDLGDLDEDTILTFIMGWTSDKLFAMVDRITIIVDNKPTTTTEIPTTTTEETTISEQTSTSGETTTSEGETTTPTGETTTPTGETTTPTGESSTPTGETTTPTGETTTPTGETTTPTGETTTPTGETTTPTGETTTPTGETTTPTGETTTPTGETTTPTGETTTPTGETTTPTGETTTPTGETTTPTGETTTPTGETTTPTGGATTPTGGATTPTGETTTPTGKTTTPTGETTTPTGKTTTPTGETTTPTGETITPTGETITPTRETTATSDTTPLYFSPANDSSIYIVLAIIFGLLLFLVLLQLFIRCCTEVAAIDEERLQDDDYQYGYTTNPYSYNSNMIYDGGDYYISGLRARLGDSNSTTYDNYDRVKGNSSTEHYLPNSLSLQLPSSYYTGFDHFEGQQTTDYYVMQHKQF